MDKDRFATAPSSWLEMNNFIGDLVAFSASSSNQLLKCTNNQSLRTAWESTIPDTPASKSCYPAQSVPSSQIQRKNIAGTSSQSGEGVQESTNCDEQQLRLNVCMCPGCPLSSASTAASTMYPLCLKSRDSSSFRTDTLKASTSQAKEPSTVALGLGSCLSLALSCEERSSESTSLSSPEHQDKSTNTHSPTPAINSSHQFRPPTLHAFPCFCCHTCPHILHPQQASEAHVAHTHSHHHYHHHHCPLTACLLCQRSFNCAQQEGHANRQHPCMHCSALFMRPSQLLQHQRTQHSSKAGGFLCPECGRVFNSHSNLRVHLNVHTGARPYVCSDCGKSFSQSGALKIHQRVHTGERPYTCTYCGRGFPHLAGVRAHQRIHTGEKPYQCTQCGKGFTQSGALKVHIRVHTGERPFICSLCGKGFSNRSGVRFHQRTAHGIITEPNSVGRPSLAGSSVEVQPKQADQAGSSQPMEHRLLSSRKNSEDGEIRSTLPYVCEDCGMRFQNAVSRNRHQAQQHYTEENDPNERHEGEQEEHVTKKTLL